jgi:DUF4097 and DUF4098 domain-containing protein YvlB
MSKNRRTVAFSIIAWVLVCAVAIYGFISLANRGGIYFSDFSLWPTPVLTPAPEIFNEQTIGDSVDSISISWVKGTVNINRSDTNTIRIVQKFPVDYDKNFLLETHVKNKTLTIIDNNNISTVTIFNVGMIKNTDLELYLPEKLYNSIKIDSLSGDFLCSGISSNTLAVNAIAGNSIVNGVFSSARVDATSGDITTNNISCPKLEVRSISGNISISGSLSDVTVESTKGDTVISSHTPLSKLLSSAVSSNTTVYIPDNNGFTLTFRKISGKFDTDFITSIADNGSTVFGNGKADFEVTAISGNFNIYKIK